MKNLLIVLLIAACGLLWRQYQSKCDELAAANERIEQQQAAAAKLAASVAMAHAVVQSSPAVVTAAGAVPPTPPATSSPSRAPDWFQKQIDQTRAKTRSMTLP